MKNLHHSFVAIVLAFSHSASAGIITAGVYADDAAFVAATGAESLTGALPNLGNGASGNAGTSVVLGDATLDANNTIFVGTGWSTLLPNEIAIAISGPEDLGITINTGLSTAFGFYFHEPTASNLPDGCNVTTCIDSLFTVEFLLGGSLVDSASYNPTDDVAEFYGFTLDMAFDSIKFIETVGSNDNEYFGEMFVARAAVPEPTTLLLIGAGLAGLALRRKHV